MISGSNIVSVLIISPAPRVQGGVSAFAEMLKTHLVRCKVTSLFVGRIHPQESFVTLIWRNIKMLVDVVKLTSENKFDVIHINPSFNTKSLIRDGLILMILRMRNFHNIMVYFHGFDTQTAKCTYRFIVLRRLFAWVLNDAKCIVVLAPEFKELLIEMGVNIPPIIIGRTMFDGQEFTGITENNARPNILFMSRFDKRKGMYELLEAFANIARDFPETDLILAGDGEESEGLHAHVKILGLDGRIKFPGYVLGKEKYELLCNCTLFALPTYFPEGMPIALIEAMAAGKPLLTAQAGGIANIMKEPDNGIVLDTVNAENIENALRKLLADKNYLEKTGAHNKAYGWANFEATIVAGEIEALYHEIARS